MRKQYFVANNLWGEEWFANVCVWNYNFYGRGCCDYRDHGDPHRLSMPVSDPRQDTDTTEPNAPR